MQDLSHGARRGKRQDDLLTVFVADGDKAADALDKLGLMAVGWAEDWDEDYQEHFDAADVIITPNNDDDSKRRCEAVARSLTGVARRVRVLNLPSIPSKGNACDWVEAGGTAKQLWQLVAKQSFNWTTDAGGDTDRLLVELTRMSPAEYGRRRRELAIELGISVTFLDREYNERRKRTKIEDDDRFLPDPDPWPEPVNGAELLEQLSKTAASHLVLPKGAADAIAMWVLFTHAHDCFDISPVLGVTSPTPECGKTTLLTFLGGVVPRPLPTSNVTAAALFRAVAKWGPTLLIDEADTFLRGNDELRGILNSGHKRSNAFVIRTSGTTTSRSTSPPWAPKAVALIGKLPSTLASRAIHISLRRKTAVEAITPLRLDRLEHLEVLLRQAARWVADNASLLRNADPQTPITLHSRSADNWRPLLAIADVAGCDWPERARHSAEKLTAGRSGETSSVLLLDDIRQLFSARETGQISVCRLGTEPHRYGTQAVARVEERQAAYAKATCRALGAIRHRPNRRLDRQEMPQGLQALAV